MSEKIIVERPIEHPMEEVFDIEAGTTLVPRTEIVPNEMVTAPDYDEKDEEIEGQLQEVYDAAMQAFENQEGVAEIIDPKYQARNSEVAVQYLNTALAAAREKANMKQHKDKIGVAKEAGPVTNNNLIVDRNELLKMLQGQEEKTINADKQDVIEGETENAT